MTQRTVVPPLDGIKVIELQGFIAGAYATTLLAELGADVIKVESRGGDRLRPILGSFVGVNSGKRSIVVDVRQKEGREIIYRWVKQGDVIIQNYRLGVTKELGIDYNTLSQMNPRLIYCSITAYGARGPLRNTPGYDYVLQAYSGICATQGATSECPALPRVPLTDLTTSMLSALGVLTALVNRERTGQGQHINTSLLGAALFTQATNFSTHPKNIRRERLANVWGKNATHRIYKTRDGYIFIDVDNDQSWLSMCKVLGHDDRLNQRQFKTAKARRYFSPSLARILDEILSCRKSQEWTELFTKQGVSAISVNNPEKVLTLPQVISNNLIVEHQTHSLGYVKQVGRVINLLRTPAVSKRGPPELGQHTDEVLKQLGYSQKEIEELRSTGVVA